MFKDYKYCIISFEQFPTVDFKMSEGTFCRVGFHINNLGVTHSILTMNKYNIIPGWDIEEHMLVSVH